jgi:hypothetical protein
MVLSTDRHFNLLSCLESWPSPTLASFVQVRLVSPSRPTEFVNREDSTKEGIETLVAMTLLGVHVNSTNRIGQLEAQTDCQHARNIVIYFGHIFFVWIGTNNGLRDALLFLVIALGTFGYPVEISASRGAIMVR